MVSVIIVNLNGGEILKQCLASLKKVPIPKLEIIIVDNGSTDGTQNLAQIKNTENLGFATGNNQGYALTHGEYVLLLNNDTTVDPDFLTKLLKRMKQDPKIGVMQPKIHIMDKPELLDNCGSYLTKTGFLQHWGYLQPDGFQYNTEREIFSAKGACMLIRREVIEKIGLFDNDYGSYFEESDFCWRVWLAGWKVLYYPKSEIWHKVGFTSKNLSPITVNYNSFKNRICTLVKNLELKNFYILLVHILLIKTIGFYYLLKMQFAKAGMVYGAIWWNVVNLPKTWSKRDKVANLRKKTDAEIFKMILVPWNWGGMLKHFLLAEKDFT